MKTYSGLFILPDGMPEAEFQEAVNRLSAEVTRAGGEVLKTETTGRKTFARRLGKRDSGCYVRLLFRVEPDKVAALTQRYPLHENLFRFQIVHADERFLDAEPTPPSSEARETR